MLHILNAKILADERERDIRRRLREQTIRRDAEAAVEANLIRTAAPARDRGTADRLCPDCPCRVAAPAR